MKIIAWLSRSEQRLELVSGFSDGMLTGLILSAGKLLKGGEPVTTSLAVRVAVIAMLANGFAFFVGRYAELRNGLVRAEHQLSLLKHGYLASTRLGRAVFWDACLSVSIVGVCSFSGAILPLLVSVMVPRPAWFGVASAIGMLALLGALLARSVYDNPFLWAAALAVLGVLLSLASVKLEVM